MFTVKTNISQFDTFKQFAEAFNLNENDLVITQSFIYEPFMKELNLKCNFVMQEKYGLGEPSDEMINNIMHDVKDKNFERIVGVGGGTVIDISKLFVLGCMDDVCDAFERKVPIVKKKQLVIVPTTCGTGSEVTNISIAELKRKHTKLGLADNAILADDAVLIPELLKSLPFKPYACSAIDALIHATESFVSPKSDNYTRLFSKEAIRIILDVFKGIVANGPDYRVSRLEEILRASNYAGIAFGNAGCGAVHALSYPLGGTYHVPHGEANYQFFTHIFKLYSKINPQGRIAELNAYIGEQLGLSQEESVNNPEALYDKLAEVLDNLLSKKPLREFGMKESDIAAFADNVVNTQQRLLKNNYTPFTRDEIEEIFRQLY
ncbi:MAG: 4-hydroxybutyrate dehydrogenase [Bacteroidales bacterium]|nr:4-hydroxybutyrate dehydrogenase [Bacteroidales bacterium]